MKVIESNQEEITFQLHIFIFTVKCHMRPSLNWI